MSASKEVISRSWYHLPLSGLAGAALAVEFRRNVLAWLAVHRAQPFQKPVNVVVVEDAGQRQLGGRMILVCHATYVARPMRAIKPKPPGAALCPR
jgi:hypothetical protein